MPKLDTLVSALEQGIKPNGSICIAFSGGLDSTVLLHVCAYLTKQPTSPLFNAQLSAIHINHGLSSHADKWQQHCQQVCLSLNVTFYTESLTLPKLSRTSIEAQAREARYAAINKIVSHCLPASTQVLLAQHQDDQLETFLLQLKRGSGVQGLGSMPAQFLSDDGIYFYRPWLDVPQIKIAEYAQQHNLQWIEDESNGNEDFDRNFIRKQITPLLKARWPGIAKTVARTAINCQRQSGIINELALAALIHAQRESGLIDNGDLTKHDGQNNTPIPILSIDKLMQIEPKLRDEVLRVWFSHCDVASVSHAQLSQVHNICRAKHDATPLLQLGKSQLRRFQGALYILSADEVLQFETPSTQTINIDTLPYSYQHWLLSAYPPSDAKQLSTSIELNWQTDKPLSLVLGKSSLRVKLFSNRPSKPLKQWFKELNVAPWKRTSIPVLCQNDEVVAVLFDDGVKANDAISSNTTSLWITLQDR